MTARASLLAALLVLCVATGLVSATDARAHGLTLQAATPREGAVVRRPTQVLTLRFSGPAVALDPRVAGPDGSEQPARVLTSPDGSVIRLRLGFRESGRHVVRWEVPQTDGHRVAYEHVLRVQLPEESTTPAARKPMGVLRTILTWLLSVLPAARS